MNLYGSWYMRGAAFILLGIVVQWVTAVRALGRPMSEVVGSGMVENSLITGVGSLLSVVFLIIGVAIILITLWHHIGEK